MVDLLDGGTSFDAALIDPNEPLELDYGSDCDDTAADDVHRMNTNTHWHWQLGTFVGILQHGIEQAD